MNTTGKGNGVKLNQVGGWFDIKKQLEKLAEIGRSGSVIQRERKRKPGMYKELATEGNWIRQHHREPPKAPKRRSWLFGEGGRGSVCFAHNMKGYDGQFLLQFLHKQGLKPDITMRGLEILCLKACSVEVKCSYNFIQMPLSALPKAFGLKELKKGYFPHLFNTPENENYTGPLPDKKYYQPDYMKPKAREKFLKWYDQQTEADYIFNFQTEFQAYCNSDVTILREALMKFRDDFIEQTAVDPLLYPVTLPSACSRVYRQNDMPEDTIAIIPEGGYRKGEKQSIIALKWLRWMAEKEDYRIQDKLHGGEKRIDGTPYRVDGYVDRSSQNLRPLVFEFHGCAWHGCSKCYSNRDTVLPNRLTAFEAYEKTVSRRMEIVLMADVEEKWECELKDELKKDQKMKEFFTSCEIQDSLNPRDAFCGGRTNATKLYQKPAEGETIKYFDVCSLYPYTNKYQPHPVGVPKIITEDFEKISSSYQP
uniref:DNA-directed DNA polymerase n=1 Tax=Plectus sambesii TaxID=2011161 RepID=A0A914V5X4_9BILA